jgi:hypothetical protein
MLLTDERPTAQTGVTGGCALTVLAESGQTHTTLLITERLYTVGGTFTVLAFLLRL